MERDFDIDLDDFLDEDLGIVEAHILMDYTR